MTAKTTLPSGAHPDRRATGSHLFAVGQLVRLRHGHGSRSGAADLYRITAVLPPGENASPQYRIRSDGESHERVTTEDRLEAVAAATTGRGAALIERTFG
ncbi:hypothetical protein [Labrys monachus]|uniref:Uncharacterized protein n=1 Tax=Labrys monachus TaxID=217067 RepID=A0ABU0FIT2_9HYPH|nr:hypothetical protein [Labrys monachus]MDQ0394525.1 hypothetical protein [Labrys monachus]